MKLQFKKIINLEDLFSGEVLLYRIDKWKFGILVWSNKFTKKS